MRKQAIVSFLGVLAVSIISGVLLWRLITTGNSLGHLGLIGVLFASMLSHLTIIARDMFLPLFLPLASVYNPLIIGAAAGTGGAIGEVTTYVLGWGVAESIEPMNEAEDRIAKWINKYGLWAVLAVALTPLPDTPVVILAGSRKLPFKKLVLVEIVGKTALYTTGAVVGGLIYSGLESSLGTFLTSGLMVVASIIFCVAVTWKPTRNIIFGWVEKLVPAHADK